jgi:transposase
MQNPYQHIGVDLAKSNLVADLPAGTACFAQTPAGLRQLLDQLPANAWVVCEATGGYERALVRACHAHGVRVTIANPKRVRFFAKSQGILAKTDRIDARVITRFARHTETLRAHRLPAETERRLRALVQARESLLDELKIEDGLDELPSGEKLLARLAAQRRGLLEKQLEVLEAEITATLAADPRLAARAARCAQVKGVGLITVASVLAFMPELGELDKGQAAALLGVAPVPDQSALRDGPRHIQGGRARLRRVLYMTAVACVRHNPVLGSLYRRLRAIGKPPKLALVALMRKLIELLNKLLKYPNFSLAH